MRPAYAAHGDSGVSAAPHPQTGLLRFITCGSVDDGKSTLIGRILFEAGAVFEDQLDMLDRDSQKFGTVNGARDFALLVDGLSAEREQGITIDVAYRYFATPRRSFIVADTPGHEQYTRNMATGASTADCAVILIDARLGVLPQTRRHSFIVSLVGVRRIVVAVNKMDLVDFDQRVFDAISADYRQAVAGSGFESIDVIPVSARDGDNIRDTSPRMPWYRGPSLLAWLETVGIEGKGEGGQAGVFPVQYVNRPDYQFRGFAGTVAAGLVKVGDRVVSLPSLRQSSVTRIVTADGDWPEAQAGQAVTLTLADEIDTSRGDVLVVQPDAGRVSVRQQAFARVLVTSDQPLRVGGQYEIKLATATAQTVVSAIHHVIDIETYHPEATDDLPINAIGSISLRLDRPVPMSAYSDNAVLGGFILIDRITRQTVAFGFMEASRETLPFTEQAQPLVQFWHRLAGAPDTLLRRQRLEGVSWRIVAAVLLAVVLAALSLPPAVIGPVVLIDLVVRPLVKIGHRHLWQSGRRPAPPVGDLDQGDGI